MVRKSVGITAALWFMLLVNMLDRVTMSFAGPTIMKSLAVSPAQFGIILSAFSIGYCISQIPGGIAADRFGSKALLVGGALSWALFTGATSLATTVAGFALVRFLFGFSEGFAATSYYKAVGENFEPRLRVRVISICSTAITVGPAVAGAVIGGLIRSYGWQTMFLVMALPAILSALVSYALLPQGPSGRAAATVNGGTVPEKANMLELFRQPSLWLLSIAAMCWAIPYWGFLGWMPSYLELARGVDLKASGATASIPYVFAFFGTLTGGLLGSTIFHKHCPHLIIVSFGFAALSLYYAFTASDLRNSLIGLSGAAFFLFGCQGLTGRVVLDFAPEHGRAAFVGIYNTAAQIGGISAPIVIGFFVAETGSFTGGFLFMIGALATSAACLVLLIPRLAAKASTKGRAYAG